MYRRSCDLFLSAFAILLLANSAYSGSYGFAGLNIDSFVMFKENSMANPMNLNSTGTKIGASDFDSGNSGHSGAGSFMLGLDTAGLSGGTPQLIQRCLGSCTTGEDDFMRPVTSPGNPTSGLHFVRTDELLVGDIPEERNTPYSDWMVAEMELNHRPTKNSFGRYNRPVTYFVRPEFTDEWVIDFQADLALRSIIDSTTPDTKITSNTIFLISIVKAGTPSEEVFRFSPNGGITDAVGGIVVADPFDLNRTTSADSRPGHSDSEYAGVGHFRAITPVLTAGTNYRFTIEQRVIVNASLIPEPSTLLLALAGFSLLVIRRR
jgi:hypothetical protein